MKTSVSQFSADINDELYKIQNSLQIHLNVDNNLHRDKAYLSTHVPREVILSSKIILDTVINALMDEAKSHLKNASTELQNKFYDFNFRNRIKDWAVQIENKLSLEPEYVKYSTDLQMVHGLIAAGVAFISGAAITGFAFIPTLLISAIASGIITVILSAVAFKIAYDKAKPKAITKMVDDIELYLESSKVQISEWLSEVILTFDNEFKNFCSNNGWETL